MSYKYRKQNRICADWILSILCGNPLIEVEPLRVDWLKYRFDTFTTRQLLGMENYTIEEINAAIRLLLTKEHIRASVIIEDQLHKSLHATIEGQDAFFESYYLKEIQKDRLESIELYTRWLIPIISVSISIVALIFSLSKK
jgi:hypothetical protein